MMAMPRQRSFPTDFLALHRARLPLRQADSLSPAGEPQRSGQRIAPAQAGEAAEIGVVRIHVRVVFERECCQLNVRRKVAAGPDSVQEAEGNLDMPGARDEVADVGLAEPCGYVSRGGIDRQRRR